MEAPLLAEGRWSSALPTIDVGKVPRLCNHLMLGVTPCVQVATDRGLWLGAQPPCADAEAPSENPGCVEHDRHLTTLFAVSQIELPKVLKVCELTSSPVGIGALEPPEHRDGQGASPLLFDQDS